MCLQFPVHYIQSLTKHGGAYFLVSLKDPIAALQLQQNTMVLINVDGQMSALPQMSFLKIAPLCFRAKGRAKFLLL